MPIPLLPLLLLGGIAAAAGMAASRAGEAAAGLGEDALEVLSELATAAGLDPDALDEETALRLVAVYTEVVRPLEGALGYAVEFVPRPDDLHRSGLAVSLKASDPLGLAEDLADSELPLAIILVDADAEEITLILDPDLRRDVTDVVLVVETRPQSLSDLAGLQGAEMRA